MLWYKAWLETRARFLISLFGILALCSRFVFHGNQQALPYTGTGWYYGVLHSGHALLATLWILAVTLLMMGGLLREKAVGASSFTLALPVSRARLMAIRVSTGLIQAMLLVIVPWSAMFLVGAVTGKTHSVSQAFFHIVLLASGGLLFFAIALLVSSLVEGEYTAPIVSYGIVMAIAVAFNDASLRAYSPWGFITGAAYFDRDTALLTGSIPWTSVTVYVLLAAVLIAVSVKVIQWREF
ncbi:MAG: hypothetical protein M3Z09_12945 [Acidobacteriota bacterium]|nr:hypothetical protein [Acidobacteriota bacterium]